MPRRSRKQAAPSVLRSNVPLGVLNASFAAAEEMTNKTNDEQARTVRITAQAFDERKRFSRFTPEDAALLAELRGVFEQHADEVVERFYDHLQQNEALVPLLSGPDTVGRLKRVQREYLLSLASGEYGEEYARGRLRIGQVHDQIGLEPEWYLGTYGLYLDLLLPLIHERFASDARRAVQATTALSKLMVLDMQLVLDAYYGMQHKKAVEKTEQLAAVGELAASIAHEVRNPLAGMKGALEVLRKELAVKPQTREVVDEILAQIVRLENLVRDLLTYARPRALSRQAFDLHELLDRLLRLYKEQSDTLGVTVKRIYGPSTSEITADPRQVEQAFINLIYNALQAMEDGGTLTISTRAVNSSIMINFKDTGKGIPPAELPKVLQPFFTTKHRGSGLGLPIVKKVVEAHGGTFEIHSKEGTGTTATVIVPDPESPDGA